MYIYYILHIYNLLLLYIFYFNKTNKNQKQNFRKVILLTALWTSKVRKRYHLQAKSKQYFCYCALYWSGIINNELQPQVNDTRDNIIYEKCFLFSN